MMSRMHIILIGRHVTVLAFHREASSGLLSFSLSCVYDVSSFATKKKTLVPATQAMIGNDKGPTMERVCACQSTERTWRGRTRGGGDKGSFVLHWFFYIMSSKMRKSRHLRKFQTISNQRAPRQLQLDDCTHPSPWGSL